MALNALAYLIEHLLKYQLSKNHNYIIVINKITHMRRRWGTPQNFYLAVIDELEKELFIKKLLKGYLRYKTKTF